MSFNNIIKLKRATIESANYFVDANVWIYSLQSFGSLTNWEEEYYQFFFDIIDSSLDPKPKILMPTLLLSEIINTYLRKVAMPDYKIEQGISSGTMIDFKIDYRPTTHYKDSYEKMMDDIYNLGESVKYIDDSLISTNESILLNNPNDTFDFNDYFYYNLCKELNKSEKTVLLTNDSDFIINDLELITNNRSLLALKKT